MKLSLVVTQGKPEGKEIPIRLSQFIIGRDPECHLRPSSPLISKRHCAILVRDGKVYLRDFDSTNGTLVNKQPLKGEMQLKDGDEIEVGPLVFRVRVNELAQDTPKPATLTVTDKKPASPTPPPKSAKKPATPEPRAIPAPAAAGLDEDSVLEMLVNLEGEPSGGVAGGADPIPPGSTIMQIVGAGQTEESAEGEAKPDDSAAKKADSKKKAPDTQATADAAKAILEKYMRRPRT